MRDFRAEGVRIELADGRDRLIDGMSAWWSAVLHRYEIHPKLNEAAEKQLHEDGR